jgi:glycosyltransferase involved in cell wall biosynthesis
MNLERTVIVKSDFLREDATLHKKIDALKRGGYVVTLLRWDRECRNSHAAQHEIGNSYEQILLKFKAPYGIKILPFLPIWWFFVLLQLLKIDCDTIHAINFDSIIPAMIVSKVKRKPLIYDMCDTYEDMVRLPHLVRWLCISVDKLFMRLADAVVIVDEARVKEFGGIPNGNVIVIYNSPPDSLEMSRASVRRQLSETFTIFHLAVFNKERRSNIDKVIGAIADIDGVELILAGFGNEVEDIKRLVSTIPGKAEFIGRISDSEIPERTANCHLLLSLYDPVGLNMKYTTTNKLFQAMMFAKPIIASKGTETGAKVEKENCGLTVNGNSIDEIREAIIKLRDNPDLCMQLGANGRRVYEQKYNWGYMEQRLLTLYREIDN